MSEVCNWELLNKNLAKILNGEDLECKEKKVKQCWQ